MQLSPLQSRLVASLAASIFLFVLYLLLVSPRLAFAAEVPLNSYEAIVALSRTDDDLQGALYEPEFELFDRSIIGRAPPGVEPLQLDQPKALNLQPGSTACYMVAGTLLQGNAASGGTPREEIKREASPDEGGDGDSSTPPGKPTRRLYLSANTCRQPRAVGPKEKNLPPQLILSVSNSTAAGCPKASNPLRDGRDKVFEEGAVVYNLTATGDIYIGITAPNVSSEFQEVYNFEVAASTDDFFHKYVEQDNSELLWMDSDSSSALLVTRNLTNSKGDIRRIMSQDLPYDLYVSNKNWTDMNGMTHSACGLQRSAQIMANSASNNNLNSPVKTAMTLRGPGGFPKQQFYFVALNESTDYTGILVRKANITAHEKRQAGGATGPGSIVYGATDFNTKSGTNCQVVTDLEFCDEIQYAVPGNPQKYNNTALAKAYDDYAKSMYANFEKVMMQIPCGAGRTSRYSLARTCDDCMTAYKRWLCTVSIPRCEDFASNNAFALVRNAGQAFPNGTKLSTDALNTFGNLPFSMVSRNPFIDQTIQPGPYKEMLPCEDICYNVVQSCPAKIGFVCPRPKLVAFQYSYGQRDANGPAGGPTPSAIDSANGDGDSDDDDDDGLLHSTTRPAHAFQLDTTMTTLSLQDVDNRVQGRLALVTGATGGIGSACARALAADGCDVALHYSSSSEKAEALASSLRAAYPSQLFPTIRADLSDRAEARGLVAALLQAGGDAAARGHTAVSVLVANAGVGRRIRDVADIGEDDWDDVLEVNARSQFVVTKACVAGMRAQGWGRVVLVGSIASKGGGINGCHYAASKGAMTSMGLNLATVLAGEGITVNIVQPAMIGATGMIPTPKTWKSTDHVEELKVSDPGLGIAASVPVHRLGVPEEVANVVSMFAKTGYMTGQEVLLAGGLK
ncbi:calcium permeable channel [Purpureocillium lavendulum]|uniref:Calcium permeable channel n=1 Tax=Purpureocillium lavendulum TaxID=1247861 RepID=A0AB34FGZ1_9HYPO|nr:calcium permeable channel [Purpureocillium lavendulum]